MKSNDEIIAEITKAHNEGQPSRVISLWGDFSNENKLTSNLEYVFRSVHSMLHSAMSGDRRKDTTGNREYFLNAIAACVQVAFENMKLDIPEASYLCFEEDSEELRGALYVGLDRYVKSMRNGGKIKPSIH
jgi:hypothetical protein